MRVLLDTQVLIWSLRQPERIGVEARTAFQEQITNSVVSVATFWEIAIKRAIGQLEAEDNFMDRVRGLGHEVLPILESHAWRAGGLPAHHKDPFDRLLIAQAQVEGIPLVTHDRTLERYDVRIIRA